MKEGRAIQVEERECGVFTEWKWSRALRKECGWLEQLAEIK